MAFAYRIVVEWSDEDQVFVARVPSLPVIAAHGDTSDAAVREVQIAAELALEVLRDEGRPVPPGDVAADFSGKVLARLPRSMHADLARAAAEDETSVNQKIVDLLGRALGTRMNVIEADPAKRKRASRAAAALNAKDERSTGRPAKRPRRTTAKAGAGKLAR